MQEAKNLLLCGFVVFLMLFGDLVTEVIMWLIF